MFLLKSLSELERIAHDEYNLRALVDGIAGKVMESIDSMISDNVAGEVGDDETQNVEPRSLSVEPALKLVHVEGGSTNIE